MLAEGENRSSFTDVCGGKIKWRRQYWDYLIYRQVKRFFEKNLTNRSFFRELRSSVSVESAQFTAKWSFKEFWQRSSTMECRCGASNKVDDSRDTMKRLRFSCPKVETEHADVLDGRDRLEARSFILNCSLYRLLKMSTKYRTYREPQFNLLYLTGSQLFKLTSQSTPDCGRRRQNV